MYTLYLLCVYIKRSTSNHGRRQLEQRYRDVAMGRWTGRPALRLLLLHDDKEPEFDCVSGAEKSLDEAKAGGWTVVSVKNDWSRVFADKAETMEITKG